MLRFFLKHILPLVLALAVLIEGVTFGLSLINVASDVAVLGGVLLVIGSFAAVGTFLVYWFGQPIRNLINQFKEF